MADITRIPDALKEIDRWCNYDPDTKAPTPAVGHPLLSFVQACSVSSYIGFHFTRIDPYAGIDIDEMTPFAQRILAAARRLGAYIERSPSGRGWHIIGLGHLPRGIGKGRVDDGVEAYSDGRYFTVTGDGEGDVNVDIQPLLDELVALLPSPNSHMNAEGAQWNDEAADALKHADCESYENWVAVGMALKDAGADFQVWCDWAETSAKWPGTRACQAKWDSFRGAGRTLGTVYMLARENGWSEPLPFENLGPEKAQPNAWKRIEVFGSDLTHEPPPRTWAWDQWAPHGVVTGLAGEPGVAKSTLALQLCVHHVMGIPYLGGDVGPGPAIFLTVEDDAHELHRRFHRVCDGLFLSPGEVVGLSLLAATDMATELVKVAKEGDPKATRLLAMLSALIEERQAKLLVLDLVGDFWDGNENARAEVSAYVRQHLGRLAARLGLSIVVISHLNKTGGVSGSTAWLGSYRSAIAMTRAEGEVIELQRIKANYAPPQEQGVKVRWQEGYIAPIPMAEIRAAADEELERRLAVMPIDEWVGVMALAEVWGCGRGVAGTVIRSLFGANEVERRRMGSNYQYRRAV